MTPPPIRAISYGGGVQSTALLALAATGRIDFPLFLMANVGDDSEHPDTMRYVREVAMPYAEANGIELALLDRVRRDGSVETLRGRLMREGSRSLPIPVRMSNGAPGTRSCTADFKIKVVARELKRRGARAPKRCAEHKAEDDAVRIVEHTDEHPDGVERFGVDRGARPDCDRCDQGNVATVGIGISLDEQQRANTRRVSPHERVVYPLISIGEETGLKLNRLDCVRVIRNAGLPVPPKSSCYFCPFHRPEAWEDLARDHPDLFDDSCHIEDVLNARRTELGKDPVYLTRFAQPLREVINTGQQLLPLVGEDDGCDTGWCFT